jgi:hypothetical protein
MLKKIVLEQVRASLRSRKAKGRALGLAHPATPSSPARQSKSN